MNKVAGRSSTMDLADFEEFLADKPDDERWELIGGRIVKMMVGARWEHHRIVQNINFFVSNHLRATGSACDVWTETFYFKDESLNAALLPDVMVSCGALEPGATSTDEPVLIFEVSSRGTEARDRLEKWEIYQQSASLRSYVLVQRDKPSVEIMHRIDDVWSGLALVEGLESTLLLDVIGCAIPLSEIYRRVPLD